MIRPRLLAAAGLVVCLGPGAAQVSAHPYLVQSAPQPGAVAASPPRAVVLSFTERVVPLGSSVKVTAAAGRPLRVRRPVLRGRSTMVAALPAGLAPAVYSVRWVALGNDGHTVSGGFRFGVRRADGSAPPGLERLGVPGDRGGQSAGGDTPLLVAIRWLGLAAAGVLLAGAFLGRRVVEGPGTGARRLRAAALGVCAVAAYVAAAAAARAGGHLSLGLLTADASGRLALARLALVLALGGAAVLWPRRSRAAGAETVLLAAVGAAVLATYALGGHVASSGASALALLGQVVHVLAAGVWMGTLITLAVARPRGPGALRAFLPLGAASVGLVAVTGVIAAVREVHASYFLRSSDYGHVVIAKALLLVALAPLAVAAVAIARRGRVAVRVLRAEAAGALVLVLLASVLVGLAPGRGQLLPAQRGNVLTGAAFASVSTDRWLARLTLAPARPGLNLVAATPRPLAGGGAARPRSLAVSLVCRCRARPVEATLRRAPSGTWAARVRLPRSGTWSARVSVDGRRAIAPAAIDASGPGSRAREVLMTADLTGPDALRCRAQAQGALLAVGRLNAGGGADGGRKVSVRVEGDGGSPGRAASLVRSARERGAVALLGPCGTGAAGAIRAARGLPTIVTDPAVPVAGGRHVWRTAGDPRAEGQAIAQYLLDTVSRTAAGRPPSRVAAIVAPPRAGSAAVDQRLAGLAAALRPAGVTVTSAPARVLSDSGALRRALDARHNAAVFVDGDAARLAAGLRSASAGTALRRRSTAPIAASSTLLDEGFARSAGNLGRTGVIAAPGEVQPDSVDGRRYAGEVQAFYGPDRPSVAGLRGYVGGLALDDALRDGSGAGAIAARLRRPKPFTDALVAPWREAAPAAGDPLFVFYAPRFLPATLVPVAFGGERHSGTFFDNGNWTRLTSRPYGDASSLPRSAAGALSMRLPSQGSP